MPNKIELLAPGGDINSIKAAIAAGADAVYCGINKFNARNRAANITFEELNGVLRLAHKNKCEVFLTLNILILENEIPDLIRLLNKLVNTSIDGVIIQDIGLFYIISHYFNSLKIHASTQATSHNIGQIKFLEKLNIKRVNLSRELSLNEISHLSSLAHKHDILTEVFVHGSYCISFSGLCYMSTYLNGNSGNRGRCSQNCRNKYITTTGNQYPLNLKDNSAFSNLQELSDAGVNSIKIEGRIKKAHYVYTVVNAYSKQLKQINNTENFNADLAKTFNRGFSNGFLKEEIGQEMFSDNPRDQSSTTREEFENLKDHTEGIINKMSVEKESLSIFISGNAGTPLKIDVKTDESSRTFKSEINLSNNGNLTINEKEILKRFKSLNDTEFFIKDIDLRNLQANLHIPFSELNSLKNKILYFLRDSREQYGKVKLPTLIKHDESTINPELFILTSSIKDISLFKNTNSKIFFQLPDSISNLSAETLAILKQNRKIYPWFPSILIAEDFVDAANFLKEVEPEMIVTDNTGIAFEANKLGCPWIAGPRLNLTNSYSLLALKEEYNCSGAFISYELSKKQIARIKKPKDFNLYYSIYHPVELMVSRQCFFFQTSGCKKEKMDDSCIPNCKKSTTIENFKGDTFYIDKQTGNYNRLYSEHNFQNMDMIVDLPNLFSGFLVDLRDISTKAMTSENKLEIYSCIERLIKNNNNYRRNG